MKFTIGFEKEDTEKLYKYWGKIIDSQQWSEGKFTKLFEEKWSDYNQRQSVAFSSWGGAALAALEFFKVSGRTVLCPSNTFMATPLSIVKAGANVEFVDCNRDDLCVSLDDLKRKIDIFKPIALWVVHIGGHIAFQINEISSLCKEKGVILIEDCAHAHGASWNSKKAGTYGDAGVYSFYATKTVSTGEGGMLVSRHPDLLEFARKFRNYGKPEHRVEGLGFRMSEFTAAIGLVQVERLEEIVAWKNEVARWVEQLQIAVAQILAHPLAYRLTRHAGPPTPAPAPPQARSPPAPPRVRESRPAEDPVGRPVGVGRAAGGVRHDVEAAAQVVG